MQVFENGDKIYEAFGTGGTVRFIQKLEEIEK